MYGWQNDQNFTKILVTSENGQPNADTLHKFAGMHTCNCVTCCTCTPRQMQDFPGPHSILFEQVHTRHNSKYNTKEGGGST